MNGNGTANGHKADLLAVFPEAHLPLEQADPELYDIIEDEKRRQWYVKNENIRRGGVLKPGSTISQL